MLIEEIIVANATSIILLLILLIVRHSTRRVRRTEDKIFTAFIIVNMVCCLTEAISFLVDGKEGLFFYIVNLLSNTTLYLSTISVSVLWIWYVDISLNRDKKRLRTVYLPLLIIWAVLAVGLIVNLFVGYIFTIDANNVYARAWPGYIYYGFLFMSFIISVVIYILFRVHHGQAQFFPIWMFLTPILLGVIIQAVWYGISLSWLSCSIGLVGIYLNIQSKMTLVDGLTGLYNRAYIEHKLVTARESQRYVYSGIMLDIDYFKEINDTYGHSVGDEALRNAARLLLTASDRNCIVFRFAGDEFIILVKMPASHASELESKVHEVEERIKAETDKFNASGETPYEIVFSIGHTLYDVHSNDDEFFHKMDEEMYKEKQKHHLNSKK